MRVLKLLEDIFKPADPKELEQREQHLRTREKKAFNDGKVICQYCKKGTAYLKDEDTDWPTIHCTACGTRFDYEWGDLSSDNLPRMTEDIFKPVSRQELHKRRIEVIKKLNSQISFRWIDDPGYLEQFGSDAQEVMEVGLGIPMGVIIRYPNYIAVSMDDSEDPKNFYDNDLEKAKEYARTLAVKYAMQNDPNLQEDIFKPLDVSKVPERQKAKAEMQSELFGSLRKKFPIGTRLRMMPEAPNAFWVSGGQSGGLGRFRPTPPAVVGTIKKYIQMFNDSDYNGAFIEWDNNVLNNEDNRWFLEDIDHAVEQGYVQVMDYRPIGEDIFKAATPEEVEAREGLNFPLKPIFNKIRTMVGPDIETTLSTREPNTRFPYLELRKLRRHEKEPRRDIKLWWDEKLERPTYSLTYTGPDTESKRGIDLISYINDVKEAERHLIWLAKDKGFLKKDLQEDVFRPATPEEVDARSDWEKQSLGIKKETNAQRTTYFIEKGKVGDIVRLETDDYLIPYYGKVMEKSPTKARILWFNETTPDEPNEADVDLTKLEADNSSIEIVRSPAQVPPDHQYWYEKATLLEDIFKAATKKDVSTRRTEISKTDPLWTFSKELTSELKKRGIPASMEGAEDYYFEYSVSLQIHIDQKQMQHYVNVSVPASGNGIDVKLRTSGVHGRFIPIKDIGIPAMADHIARLVTKAYKDTSRMWVKEDIFKPVSPEEKKSRANSLIDKYKDKMVIRDDNVKVGKTPYNIPKTVVIKFGTGVDSVNYQMLDRNDPVRWLGYLAEIGGMLQLHMIDELGPDLWFGLKDKERAIQTAKEKMAVYLQNYYEGEEDEDYPPPRRLPGEEEVDGVDEDIFKPATTPDINQRKADRREYFKSRVSFRKVFINSINWREADDTKWGLEINIKRSNEEPLYSGIIFKTKDGDYAYPEVKGSLDIPRRWTGEIVLHRFSTIEDAKAYAIEKTADWAMDHQYEIDVNESFKVKLEDIFKPTDPEEVTKRGEEYEKELLAQWKEINPEVTHADASYIYTKWTGSAKELKSGDKVRFIKIARDLQEYDDENVALLGMVGVVSTGTYGVLEGMIDVEFNDSSSWQKIRIVPLRDDEVIKVDDAVNEDIFTPAKEADVAIRKEDYKDKLRTEIIPLLKVMKGKAKEIEKFVDDTRQKGYHLSPGYVMNEVNTLWGNRYHLHRKKGIDTLSYLKDRITTAIRDLDKEMDILYKQLESGKAPKVWYADEKGKIRYVVDDLKEDIFKPATSKDIASRSYMRWKTDMEVVDRVLSTYPVGATIQQTKRAYPFSSFYLPGKGVSGKVTKHYSNGLQVQWNSPKAGAGGREGKVDFLVRTTGFERSKDAWSSEELESIFFNHIKRDNNGKG